MDGATERLHATSIAVNGRAAVIIGPSGSGKSDLALRCLTAGPAMARNAEVRLVADDQSILVRRGHQLIVSAPDELAGRLEIRGVGIVTVDVAHEAAVALVVDISAGGRQPRYPDPWPTVSRLGLSIPLLRLAPFEPSAAAKLLAALTLAELPSLTDTLNDARS